MQSVGFEWQPPNSLRQTGLLAGHAPSGSVCPGLPGSRCAQNGLSFLAEAKTRPELNQALQ